MVAKLTFHGGAGSVTGAHFLLEIGASRLLVDCGAEAQEYVCDPTNAEAFPYAPDSITALLVTHAHQDHIGRIPKLVRDGFRGQIFSTAATRDLSAVMLDDALSVMTEEVEQKGCEPLYERADIERSLSLWQTLEYHEPREVGESTVEFFDAGHILGSALIKISRAGRSIVFTGDIGNSPEPLLHDTEIPEGMQYLVMESVYGDRVHEDREQRRARLKAVIMATIDRGGTLLIPSFSLERTQVLLYEIHSMIESGEIRHIDVYMDSPLAARVTEIFRRYAQLFNQEAQKHLSAGQDLFTFRGLKVTETSLSSRAIHSEAGPKIIIAGAGMSAGGRVRAHEKKYLGERDTTLLFVGYQAAGSLGRRIQEGARSVIIDGTRVHVRARIETLTGYSGHADREQLLDFVEGGADSLEKVFVTMGEPGASLFLAQRVRDFLGIDTLVPRKSETVSLDL